MQTTYGLGTTMGSGPRVGAGLMAQGQDQEQLGTQLLGQAAQQETERNIGNARRKAEAQQGGAQLGGMVGAQYGMAVGGPWGALAGGIIGSLAGSNLF